MTGPRSGQRMELSEVSRRVWRAVAARGASGVSSAEIHDGFKGQIDSLPLSTTLKSLGHGGYLRRTGSNRWGGWVATDRVPLGEDRPAWLDDVETEPDAELDKAALAEQAVASAKATATPWPFGKLPDGGYIDRVHSRASAPAPAASVTAVGKPATACVPPWFALDSDGCLSLRADDLEGKLSADSTRALFSWLDRIAYVSLRETVEVAS